MRMPKPTIIIGIDPGVKGAVAIFEPVTGRLSLHDMPLRKRPSGRMEVDGVKLAEILAGWAPLALAVVEKVAAMTGKESAANSFQFGRSFGVILGVLAALKIDTVETRPAVWKAMLGLGTDKSESILRARTLFPDAARHFALKKHDGRAEAALLTTIGVKFLARYEDDEVDPWS
jgi:hypothetical protein